MLKINFAATHFPSSYFARHTKSTDTQSHMLRVLPSVVLLTPFWITHMTYLCSTLSAASAFGIQHLISVTASHLRPFTVPSALCMGPACLLLSCAWLVWPPNSDVSGPLATPFGLGCQTWHQVIYANSPCHVDRCRNFDTSIHGSRRCNNFALLLSNLQLFPLPSTSTSFYHPGHPFPVLPTEFILGVTGPCPLLTPFSLPGGQEWVGASCKVHFLALPLSVLFSSHLLCL